MLSVEQRTRPASTILKRNRIEVWKDGTEGTRAVRLYDEQSRVVAGLWTAQDGTRTRYAVGQRPTVELHPPPTGPTVQDVWTRDVSADAFLSLVGSLENTVVVTNPSTYVISHRPHLEPGADGLVEASLTLAQDEHRATDQLVVIRENGSEHEFHWREVRTEVVPIATLTSTVFEPEAVLLGLPEPARPTIVPYHLRQCHQSSECFQRSTRFPRSSSTPPIDCSGHTSGSVNVRMLFASATGW